MLVQQMVLRLVLSHLCHFPCWVLFEIILVVLQPMVGEVLICGAMVVGALLTVFRHLPLDTPALHPADSRI